MSEVSGPVLIIGAGLIGTSIGLALRSREIEVFLRDAVPGHAIVACELGAGKVDPGGLSPRIVVVSVPPRHAAEVIAQASIEFPDATITDVTSVKARVLADSVALGADAHRVVGGHPMAGREVSGATGARVDLLNDRTWILTPGGVEGARLLQVRALVEACGAVCVEMDAAEHDRAVALVSHVPQLLSTSLAGELTDADEQQVRVSGQGLRDMTRIAASDAELWTDILSANSGPVVDVLDDLIARLTRARDSVARSDSVAGRDDVRALLREGSAGRARIPGKHGLAASDFAVVAVMLEDAPGELARLFAAAGDEGINTEDVRIEHVLGRPSGLVELLVRPDRGDALRSVLRARGFDVRS